MIRWSILTLLSIFCLASYAQKSVPINSGQLISEAIVLNDSGAYKKAIALYEQIDRNDTNYVRALLENAITHTADSDYKKAALLCEEALALKTQREYEPELLNQYASLMDYLGLYQKADSVYQAGIKKYPAFTSLYFNRGILHFNQAQYEQSEEDFKKTLLVDPYMFSAHYFLALSALHQGKIVPAFLSFMGYLTINPGGKYSNASIAWLSKIGRATDEIIEFKNKRTNEPNENYKMTEEIIISQVALEKEYKSLVSLDDPLLRQIQVVFEKQEFVSEDPDFWMQYYIPFYKKIFSEGSFEPFIFWAFENVENKEINEYNRKNKKSIDGVKSTAADYFNEIQFTRERMFSKRAGIKERYYFDEGTLTGKGVKSSDGKWSLGAWTYFYHRGNLKATGQFSQTGKREGEWLFYYTDGQLSSREFYNDGKLEGKAQMFYNNGNLYSSSNYSNDLLEGEVIYYHENGNVNAIGHYQKGKLNGDYAIFTREGFLNTTHIYTNDNITGKTTIFFKNEKPKEAVFYENNIKSGLYTEYFEGGKRSGGGLFVKDLPDGIWDYYYENGQLKSHAQFVKNKKTGPAEEYYEDGVLKNRYNYKDGKISGESLSFDTDGKLYAKFYYEDDILISARFFNKKGEQISLSERKNKTLELQSYYPDGRIASERHFDEKGQLTGIEKDYYHSGKLSDMSSYADGEANGTLTNYFPDGTKKHEFHSEHGVQNGAYVTYNAAGTIESEGWLLNDIPEGYWNNYNTKGQLTDRSYFLNGEMTGYREEFLPTGVKILEKKFVHGWLAELKQFDSTGKLYNALSFPRFTGKYILTYPNGQIMEEGFYKNGNFEGKFTKYYFDGSILSTQYFKRGVEDSLYLSYYYKGKLNAQGQFKAGRKTGKWSVYNENGEMNYTSVYDDTLGLEKMTSFNEGVKDYESTIKNDVRHGITTGFAPDGTISYVIRYDEGNAIAYSYLDSQNKLVPEIPIDKGSFLFRSYYPNGRVSKQCMYIEGKRSGENNIYFQDSKPYITDTCIYNLYQGTRKEYYSTGKLKELCPYYLDNQEGRQLNYNAQGILVREANYTVGLLHGPAKYYDDKGNLTETRFYNYGILLSSKNEK